MKPDAISMAKGLGGGFPIGAMLTTDKLVDALPAGTHGSTFGGNALASGAALAVLQIMDDEKLVDGARTKGEALGAMLHDLARQLPDVCESARGEGLLWGLVMRPGYVAREVLPRVNDAGLLLTGAGERVLRFSPPLVVSIAELEEGVAILRRVLSGLRGQARAAG
jgi:acetylornithine/N-succinyldiaminopimelate aminotransferase